MITIVAERKGLKTRICIISEGSYPIIPGGLSEWAHMLIKNLKDVEFEIFCIVAFEEDKPWVYERLPNINNVVVKPLMRSNTKKTRAKLPKETFASLEEFFNGASEGKALGLENLVKAIPRGAVGKSWLRSQSYWEFIKNNYQKNDASGSFLEYFWTSYGLDSMMLDSLNFVNEIPEADVYHCVSTGFAGFAGALAKAAFNKPLVITEQGLYLNERRNDLTRQKVSESYGRQLIQFSESMIRTSYRYVDKLVPPCLSHIPIETDLGADVNKIQVINNGIEIERFQPSARPERIPVIGCFARVVPIKGVTDLIEAAKIVIDRCPVEFVMLGDVQDQQYYEECQELVQKLGIGDHFKFMGHINPVEWYPKVDVFTLASLSEGVPYALLEAMSCGLPSVCTAVGGVPEILSGGVGFVVPPGHPEQLAEKYYALISNRELRLEMGARATEKARNQYTIKKMGDDFRGLYEELINEY
jgi:glycosyltransferase involved in cell wall biosynthesis